MSLEDAFAAALDDEDRVRAAYRFALNADARPFADHERSIDVAGDRADVLESR